LLPFGLILYLLETEGSSGILDRYIHELVFLFFLIIVVNVVMLFQVFRNKAIRFIEVLAIRYTNKNFNFEKLYIVDAAISKAFKYVKKDPKNILISFIFSVTDWTFSIATMGAGFYALGFDISIGVLITGFIVGMFVGILSFVPGGIGVQEFTSAAVFVWMGVPFEVAVLASVLFRLFYYFIPLLFVLAYEGKNVFALVHSSAVSLKNNAG
jgi:uncharacterized protein (TIRG00374 family)